MAQAPLNPQQDREAGLSKLKDEAGRWVTLYDPKVALEIVERIAEGELLMEICAPGTGMPHRGTFHRWVVAQPELARAYNAARELSAMSLEERALALANELEHGEQNHVKTRALDVAMQQYRWSAARRDPAKFGDKVAAHVRVPIQINTTLNLGEDVAGDSTPEHPNVYTIEAELVEERPITQEDEDRPLVPKPPDGKVATQFKPGPRKKVLKPRAPATKRLTFQQIARGEGGDAVE